MSDEHKTGEELLNKPAQSRQRISQLEALENERDRVEQALRESEMKLRSLVQTAIDAIITTDAEGSIVSWNKDDRIILETDRFVVFQPFASRFPFETWIAAREHRASFGQATRTELKEFARILRDALRRLYLYLDNPDYNMVIHSSPLGDENKLYFTWHVQIIPRLTIPAGFELGSGIYINTAVSEETAAALCGLKT